MLTAYLLLPRELIDRYMDELGLGRQIKLLNKVFAPKEYALFSEMAKRLGVSKTALSIRLDNLGMIGRNDFSDPYAPTHITMARLCPYCKLRLETLCKGAHGATYLKCPQCGEAVFFPPVVFRIA